MKRILPLAFLLSGCALAHRPHDSDPRHLEILWRTDFAAASMESAATGRPVLACLVAGDITDDC